MTVMFYIGILLLICGLAGFIGCILFGFQIKKQEKRKSKTDEEIKKLLIQFSSLNMISLMISFMGLTILVIAIILR
mgnify:CR=1 FL=1